jgi:two-component system, OmpR family, KDP operon response regulator KdpE
MPAINILIIEDDPSILMFLRHALSGAEYRVIEASTARHGLQMAASYNPELVLLDLGLPDFDGIEVIRQMRESSARPIIIISARGQERDKIAALDAGADDYLTKPFALGELMARIRACVRRSSVGGAEEPVFTAGELSVDLARRRVTVAGAEAHLTPVEYKLLTELVRHAGKVLTHRHLLKEVWGAISNEQAHYVRIGVHGLRQKIEPVPARPRYVLTEPGVGYRLAVDD